MNNIEKVKEIMGFDNCYMDEDVEDFDIIADLIVKDGYDIEGFELLEIPHPKVFCFGNNNTKQFFDVVKFGDDKWQFSYLKSSKNGLYNELAHSIQEAVENYEYD